jgi:ammonium transporter, Amt family
MEMLILCGIGALLARLAQTLFLAGSTRSKNTGSSILRMILDMGLVCILFFFVGTLFFPLSLPNDVKFFLMAALLTGSCAPICSASERSRLYPSLIPSILISAVLFPLFYRWTHYGFLSTGFIDLGAAASIHLPAGLCATLLILFVGPRSGKYNRDGSSNAIPGNSLPITSAGLILMFISWFFYLIGFSYLIVDNKVGNSLDNIPINLMMSVSAGILASCIFSQIRYSKPDIHVIMTGVLGAMIAITPFANTYHHLLCVIVGAVAGIGVPFILLTLDLRYKLDDVTGSGVIHGIGSLIGLIIAPIEYSFKYFGKQYLGLLIVVASTLLVVGGVLFVFSKFFPLRSKEADEFDGLDLAEHDINSWPDFQQTMIKSYHLREA